ncbi:MAG: HDIG domain-containing metalloprotein [Peptostreptococcales bacterium]
MDELRIALPHEVEYILEKLQEHDFEGFIVGGCVRDAILHRNPFDWDITTNAFPEDIKKIFKDTIDTGIQHGTITIVINQQGFEVTTYRTDGIYKDKRRPEEVKFIGSIIEDLKRRDFTINAMAYNHEKGLVDPFEGVLDIHRKVIRCVGNPRERFNEDGLRILRAIRFASQLNFKIDNESKEAILELGDNLKYVAMERIRDEISKIVISDHPCCFKLIYELGFMDKIIPEYEDAFHTEQNIKYHQYNVALHSLKAMTCIENQLDLRLTMLLHDIGKPYTKTVDESGIDHFYGHTKVSAEIAKSILTRMKYNHEIISTITCLIKYHNAKIGETSKSIKRYLNKIGPDNFFKLLKVKRADNLSKNPKYFENSFERLEKMEMMAREILKSKECFEIKDLAINGYDLMELGIKQGKEIGLLLKEILDFVIEEPEMNHKDYLLQFALDRMKTMHGQLPEERT